ncbi:hypothetical protein BASA81_004782 [Batrachochytrium salamandrivorans]|nr:hypothetical protein BASA81_004782 [Batrachochytrium salamandrivorans]
MALAYTKQKMFARTGFTFTSTTPVLTVEKETPQTKPTSTNLVPEALKKLVDQSVIEFEKHRLGDLTCDGAKWEVVSRTPDGDVISKAEFPGQSFLRWRIESTVYGKFDQVIDEMFNFSKRAGPQGWDPKLASGLIHKTYDDGYRLCQLATNPVLGGLVSGREFVEIRHVMQDDNALTFRNSGVSLDEKERMWHKHGIINLLIARQLEDGFQYPPLIVLQVLHYWK